MVILAINYNWRQYSSSGYSDHEYNTYTVGKDKVIKILEHPAVGEGDRWFYDVHFEDGRMERIFNPNQIFYKPE